MSSIESALPGMTVSASANDREKLKVAAKNFEAIFMRQMLAAARKTDFGGESIFGSQALTAFRQLQDEHFADLAANSGTLGMAAIIEAQMTRLLPNGRSATDPEGTS